MIRYDFELDQLEALVDEHKPGWRARAKERTDELRRIGAYEENSSIWGEIKAVYMQIQGAKCSFCERKFEGDFSQYELDLEHFRPKRIVRKWPCPSELATGHAPATAPPAGNSGYYLLSYHLLNYAAVCKPCNSGLKQNYFPISGEYNFVGTEPNDMHAEQPWLLYPIGSADVDPEDAVSFHGMLPHCKSDDPNLQLRGLATIAFFQLDDVIARKNLMRERAQVIFILHCLLQRANEEENPQMAEEVGNMIASSAAHANCARSFKRLFDLDHVEAAKVAEKARRFIGSIS